MAEAAPKWDKRWLSGLFYGEGAAFGDFNNDGKLDVVSGPFIYDAPEFTLKRAFTDVKSHDPLAYSDNFFEYTHDFDQDGWTDILVIGFPGKEAFWYRNPGNESDPKQKWERHLVLKVVDNESPMLANIVGDDSPELVCMSGGYAGYAAPDSADPTKPWTFHPLTPKSDYQRFTHGIGAGDVNGDGRLDLLEKNGWWEQPEKLDDNQPWTKHPFAFAPGSGPAQMFAYDVDGDGDNDVVTCLNAHGYGLAWYEHLSEADGGKISFKQHLILSPKPDEKIHGVQFSQLHALELIDMDGDGLKDILTGKRFWAHGPTGDPEPTAAPVLYYFKLNRTGGSGESGKPTYEPVQIDDYSGVGTQITAADANADGTPDIVVGNKRGTILFLSKK
ncbi:MAG TPA: VCBS repeat-containing protein [Tepidisphaeraceae bacterium]|nr:VCBS repeat-containing protein [Tepidisphaeraceae bacterium]